MRKSFKLDHVKSATSRVRCVYIKSAFTFCCGERHWRRVSSTTTASAVEERLVVYEVLVVGSSSRRSELLRRFAAAQRLLLTLPSSVQQHRSDDVVVIIHHRSLRHQQLMLPAQISQFLFEFVASVSRDEQIALRFVALPCRVLLLEVAAAPLVLQLLLRCGTLLAERLCLLLLLVNGLLRVPSLSLKGSVLEPFCRVKLLILFLSGAQLFLQLLTVAARFRRRESVLLRGDRCC